MQLCMILVWFFLLPDILIMVTTSLAVNCDVSKVWVNEYHPNNLIVSSLNKLSMVWQSLVSCNFYMMCQRSSTKLHQTGGVFIYSQTIWRLAPDYSLTGVLLNSKISFTLVTWILFNNLKVTPVLGQVHMLLPLNSRGRQNRPQLLSR